MIRWTVRNAMPEDLPVILGLYDAAVVWLNAQGVTGQWGTTPLSEGEGFARRIQAALTHGVVAEGDGVYGFIYVTLSAPSYLKDITGDAAYARGLVASRAPQARGVGTALLQWAENYAVQQGKRFLRLDCWAGNPKLIAYYERHGFTRRGEFTADGWQGVLMEKPLPINAAQ